jgi:hypothetical protein
MIYKTLHRKRKFEHHEPHLKPRMNSGAPEGLAVPAPQVTLVRLLLSTLTASDTEIVLDTSIRK